ncbi:MAG: hypothetical protein OXH32_03720 [Acidobacteria bacterium]|nr:hypothetical protein [Acidobacteriota bacterium]MXZ37977.1 hypothetical protein [Holophagales bacterium]
MATDLHERMLANRQVLAEMKAIEASTAAHAEEVAELAEGLARAAERIDTDLQRIHHLHGEAVAELESLLQAVRRFGGRPFILAAASGSATGVLIGYLLLN